MNKKVLAIIPARGGSKGVPRKNVKIIAGKPLIAWSIDSAKQSNRVNHFYVSTDDAEIKKVSERFGAAVIERPEEFAQDRSPMIPALQHACAEAEKEYGKFDFIVLLQPTAPQRIASDIDESILLLDNSGADSLISVYLVEDTHPSRMYRIHSGILESYAEEPVGSLRQDLEKVYHRNGAIYACKRDLLMEKGELIGSAPIPYVMPKERSGNIDDPLDFKITELMLKQQYSLE